MLAKARSSLTYANVMATLAVFVALGGTSYAVATGSVDSREIKNNTVRSKDVRNRSLLAKDFKRGQLRAGPTGPKGDKGDAGAPGSARAYGEVMVNASDDYALVPGHSKNVTGLTQGGGDNSAACIQLDPAIDASTAVVVATPNAVGTGTYLTDGIVSVGRPPGYCGPADAPPNSIEIYTEDSNSPGSPSKRAFFFAVM